MEFSITSSDIGFIEEMYHKFQANFYDTSPKEASLEIIAADKTYSNPSWNKIEELHKEYLSLKIKYNIGEIRE